MLPRISILVPDVSNTVMGAATELAGHLASFAEVQVVGPDLGHGVCPLYRDAFPYTVVPAPRIYRFPEFFAEARRLADAVTGDLVVAVKAVADTVPVAWWLRRKRGRKMVVYLDEWDGALMAARPPLERLARRVRHLHHPLDEAHAPWVERLIPGADLVVSTNTALQRRFGGEVVPMGVDTDYFAPGEPAARAERKAALGLTDRRLIVFGGVARPHKGVDLIVEALARLGDRSLHLLIVGPATDYVKELQAQPRWAPYLTCTGGRTKAEMPGYLDVADLFVLPLEDTELARTQTPCKVYEAMAMGKPVVATRISDLPQILEGCGELVPPSDAGALAAAIAAVLAEPARAARLGQAARARAVALYSKEVTRGRLRAIFSGLLPGSDFANVRPA